MERITVLGMGPVGASIGLALKNVGLKNTEVVGHSDHGKTASILKQIGAFDIIAPNAREALSNAQLVVIDGPVGSVQEMVEAT